MRNAYWRDGIMGVVTGDALGCPVQFCTREEVREDSVTEMTGHGTYDMPAGTWTDDTSLTLATLVSIREKGGLDPDDIMRRFAKWLTEGEYTPFGEAFDCGIGTTESIVRYLRDRDPKTCGGSTVQDNGNGSLMRILPVCLYCYEETASGRMTDTEAVSAIHEISALTHAHMRAEIACGLYFFLVRAVLRADRSGAGREDDLIRLLQAGMDEGFAFYRQDLRCLTELAYYGRLRDLYAFRELSDEAIRSSGYVVDTLEAALWSLLKTSNFRDALLTAVGLGDDTDTVGAVCGGLAGLFYGYEDIPEDWLAALLQRERIEGMCARNG